MAPTSIVSAVREFVLWPRGKRDGLLLGPASCDTPISSSLICTFAIATVIAAVFRRSRGCLPVCCCCVCSCVACEGCENSPAGRSPCRCVVGSGSTALEAVLSVKDSCALLMGAPPPSCILLCCCFWLVAPVVLSCEPHKRGRLLRRTVLDGFVCDALDVVVVVVFCCCCCWCCFTDVELIAPRSPPGASGKRLVIPRRKVGVDVSPLPFAVQAKLFFLN